MIWQAKFKTYVCTVSLASAWILPWLWSFIFKLRFIESKSDTYVSRYMVWYYIEFSIIQIHRFQGFKSENLGQMYIMLHYIERYHYRFQVRTFDRILSLLLKEHHLSILLFEIFIASAISSEHFPVCMYVHLWMCMCACLCVSVCMCIYVVCMYVRVCMCTHTCAHVCTCMYKSVYLHLAWAEQPPWPPCCKTSCAPFLVCHMYVHVHTLKYVFMSHP